MQFVHTQKFVRMSPTKIRSTANLIKKLKLGEAVKTLPFIGKRAANPLEKVLKAAVANAKQGGASESDLIIKEIQVTDGPRLKRGRPVSRGRWHPYKKRMSHIRIVLETKEAKSQKPKGKSKKEDKKDAKTKKQENIKKEKKGEKPKGKSKK